MEQSTPAEIVAVAVFMVVLVLMLVLLVPRWWSGRSTLSITEPPSGWIGSAGMWVRSLHAAVPAIIMLILGSAAVLIGPAAPTLSGALAFASGFTFLVWLAELIWARPRFLIPPPWRPGTATRG